MGPLRASDHEAFSAQRSLDSGSEQPGTLGPSDLASVSSTFPFQKKAFVVDLFAPCCCAQRCVKRFNMFGCFKWLPLNGYLEQHARLFAASHVRVWCLFLFVSSDVASKPLDVFPIPS